MRLRNFTQKLLLFFLVWPAFADDFEESTLISAPDIVNPTCLAVSARGSVFIGCRESEDRGKVVVCVDRDNDGKAEIIKTYAKTRPPRDLVYENGFLWVLEPPFLRVYRDRNLDGESETATILIDHLVADSLQLAIDGWLYIGVNDHGFQQAVSADGSKAELRGSGVLRVRPSGGELEVYATGLRYAADLALDSRLHLFAWNRQVFQNADYGIPLALKSAYEDSAGAIGHGENPEDDRGLYLEEPGWASGLLTCNQKSGELLLHRLKPKGATFKEEDKPEVFRTVEGATDLAVDGSGRLYISSLAQTGRVVRLTPKDKEYVKTPQFTDLPESELLRMMLSESAVRRLAVQQELLRRKPNQAASMALNRLAMDVRVSIPSRVAAMYTLKQWGREKAHVLLDMLASTGPLRGDALRMLADRKSQLRDVPIGLFLQAVKDPDPRVRIQALVGLGRMGYVDTAPTIIPLTSDTDGQVGTLAQRTLAVLGADEPCLTELHRPQTPYYFGTTMALRSMHTSRTVNQLLKLYELEPRIDARIQMLSALIRLYHREAPFAEERRGVKPDTEGPYYIPETWLESGKIKKAVMEILDKADEQTAKHIRDEIELNGLDWEGTPAP